MALLVIACNPFKVTDPANPNFEPMKFRFEDYKQKDISRVLNKMFPIGTPKSDIDRVFVNAMNLDVSKNWPFDKSKNEITKDSDAANYAVFFSRVKRNADGKFLTGEYVRAVFSQDNRLSQSLYYQPIYKGKGGNSIEIIYFRKE